MGIFDIFKGKQVKPEPIVTGVVEPVAPVAPVEPAKKPGRKKAALTEGPTKGSESVPVKKRSSRKPKSPPAAGKKKAAAKKSDYQTTLEKAKAEATAKGEPWVSVLSVELDMDNLSNGSFNLDWNDHFVAKLVRAGYKGTDVEMVDAWFQDICRNIIQENFEQEMADPTNRPEDFKYPRKS